MQSRNWKLSAGSNRGDEKFTKSNIKDLKT